MLNYIGDRLLKLRLQRDEKEIKIGLIVIAVITIIIVFLLGNVIYLNLSLSKKSQTPTPSAPSQAVEDSTSTPSTAPSASPSLLPTTAPSSATTTTNSTVKDYYFNLGSGSNQSSDWADVPGALSTFDIAQYQNIKEIHLETNINVPTANGTISVRLFNKTDNYAVWNSERTVQSQAKGDLIISPNIIYDVGPKLYQVQIKSQLSIPANLIQSRIHIVTN